MKLKQVHKGYEGKEKQVHKGYEGKKNRYIRVMKVNKKTGT